MRDTIRTFVTNPAVDRAIMILIVINAIMLDLETSPTVMASVGPLLLTLAKIILAIFTIEIVARIYAHGRDF